MTKQIYAVFDSAAKLFLDPFFVPTHDFALREFRTAINKEGHQFAKYPEDYILFYLGDYNPATGAFDPQPAPVSMGVGSQFVAGNTHPVPVSNLDQGA